MKDIIIARKEEKRMLHNLRNEKTAQLLAVYGRRRVGKTFLIREYFEDAFSFKHTALSPLELRDINPDALYKAQLAEFKKFENDDAVLKRLEEIKAIKKKQFADFAYKKQGVIIDPNTLFDVQAKRLHEYKRQLLNVLHIISVCGRKRKSVTAVAIRLNTII